MPTIAGCDAKDYRRGTNREFFANIGLTVEVDTNGILEMYDQTRSKLCEKYAIELPMRMVNATSVRRKLGPARASQFGRDFVQALTKFIDYIHVGYTAFNSRKLPYTWLYPLDPKRKQVGAEEFVRTINSGYAHFCCDYYITQTGSKLPVRLDSFSYPRTNAWARLQNYGDLKVYFKGDQCNVAIAMADLLLAAVDDGTAWLWRKNIETAIQAIFPQTQYKVSYISHIDDIRALTRTPLDFTPFVAHPIVFVVKEFDVAGEAEILEDSPLMASCCNLALERDGCAKIFEPRYTNDSTLIQKGDIFVHQGPNGREKIRVIEKAGHEVEVLNHHEVLSRFKVK